MVDFLGEALPKDAMSLSDGGTGISTGVTEAGIMQPRCVWPCRRCAGRFLRNSAPMLSVDSGSPGTSTWC